MTPEDPGRERDAISKLLRGVRLDLVIAVCALLISSLATAASWWQTRMLEEQTQVLQQQLGAQVWPYVDVTETIDDATARVTISNNGLGPAVLRSASVTVDGKPERSFIDVLHAILGPGILARKPRGEKLAVGLSAASPGTVMRPGETSDALTLTSKSFAPPFLRASSRIAVRLCYCAIIPGKCWQSGSSATGDPQPVAACRENPHDLLHSSPVVLIDGRF